MSHSFISHATQKSFNNAKMSCNYANLSVQKLDSDLSSAKSAL